MHCALYSTLILSGYHVCVVTWILYVNSERTHMTIIN